jgi:class 3 adenylate cyclase
MALFGVLNHKDDEGKADALAAVKAAIDLRPRFDEAYKHWLEQWTLYTPHKIEIGLGCGIHTGEAHVGNMGTDFRDQLTAVGPHVNFTSRLEGRADSGQILISQTTEVRVHSHVRSVKIGTTDDLKNIAGDYELFSVQSLI